MQPEMTSGTLQNVVRQTLPMTIGYETIVIYIDGVQVDTAITSITGEFSASIRADAILQRKSCDVLRIQRKSGHCC